jgi:hypothetical protein
VMMPRTTPTSSTQLVPCATSQSQTVLTVGV